LTKIHPKKNTHTHTTYNMCSKLSLNETNLIDPIAYETTQCKKVCTNLLHLHKFVTHSNYYLFDILATFIRMLCLLERTHFAYSWGHTLALAFFLVSRLQTIPISHQDLLNGFIFGYEARIVYEFVLSFGRLQCQIMWLPRSQHLTSCTTEILSLLQVYVI
jgi:hypothetical protein